MTFLIHAPNVHQGGGRTLLLALLDAARARPEIAAVVDARLPLPPDLLESMIFTRVASSVGTRLAAEWRLRTRLAAGDTVLCFGNLPPLFGARARVVLFLQNRYLLGRRQTHGLPLTARLRIELERVWLRARLSGVDRVIVQTASMAREVKEQLGVTSDVLPFAAPRALSSSATGVRGRIDFLYVSTGEPHKNHRNLLAAWRQLAEEGFCPSLCLTVSRDSYPALCADIDEARSKYNVNVENAGAVAPSAMDALYASAAAVIHPSRFESLALPLLEARAHGLPILAPELDYVRDLIDPVESFDPGSPVSIARAVKRFCRRAESRPDLLTPAQFIDRVL